jgi:autotransporter-associated beta strand protein
VLLDVTQASGVVTANRPNGNYTSLIKGGLGQLTLTNAGANDSGNLTVNQGTVVLSGSTNVGTGFANVGQIDNVLPDATVKLGNGNGGQVYFDYSFHMSGGTFDLNGINGAQMPAIDGSGIITNSVAATTGTASFKINGAKTFTGTIVDGAGKTAVTLSGGTGTWTLTGINTHTGNTAVNSGSLILADNAGMKFAITNAASNSITGGGTATFHGDFTIDTSAVAVTTGTWTLVNAATLNESFTPSFTVVGFTPHVNGIIWTKVNGTQTWTFTENDGKLVLSVSPATPFSTWATAKGLVSPNADPDDDPDKDGSNNLAEFAFNGNPLSATNNGFQRLATEDTPADFDALKELTLTLAVRNGNATPSFSGSPSLSATVDGILYTIEGSLDLNFPGSVVSETAAPVGLQALPSGYEYRRFRLNSSNDLSGKGFLRARISIP